MSLLGIHLSLWMGEAKGKPTPVSFSIAEALTSVQVTHSDSGPSGFQLTFQVGRSGPLDMKDYGLLTNSLLRPFKRVILLVRFAIVPQVLMDGIITQVNLSPSDEPGASTLTVTGQDVSVMMDLEQKCREFPALPDYGSVIQIITDYLADYGLKPPEPPLDTAPLRPSNPLEQIRQQPGITDRAFLQELAHQYGFVFYVTPGPVPYISMVHWGPPTRLSLPQSALAVNMGPASNVESINFTFDGLRPEKVNYATSEASGTISEPSLSRSIPPLARDRPEARRLTHLATDDDLRAEYEAQGMVDRSFDDVVTATGQLDALRYNGLLNPRGLVGLRGAGHTFDGLYYVKSVTHNISKGRYTQSFSLSREGTGPVLPVVLP